ncbi:MAG TPA: ABC transporter permease [Ktedonobacterales bacterium]|nr:ABC transporter permease [Ktedonobacterales bacterium]
MTSATIAKNNAVLAPGGALHAARPSFVGIVGGELLKLRRQWSTWLLALVVAGSLSLQYLVFFLLSNTKARFGGIPDEFRYIVVGVDATMLKVFGGALLIVVTARLIGMEYSSGTIRVVLARGVGRLQLLLGKLTAVTLVALALSGAGVAYSFLLKLIVLAVKFGSLDILTKAPSTFWQDSWVLYLTILISFGTAILLAAAVAVVGRSLAFGLTVGIVWFPAENFATLFLFLASSLTGSNFWAVATGDLLGPNLNVMGHLVLPDRAAYVGAVGLTPPVVPVTGGHTLLVTAVWAAIFLAVAIILTWRRDVKE